MDYIYYEIMDTNNERLKTKQYHEVNDYITSMIQNNNEKAIIDILPALKSADNWGGCAYKIFKYIYLKPELNEYTFYLLHKGYVEPQHLSPYTLDSMLKYTTWGFEYIINNLETIFNEDKHDCKEKMEVIMDYVKDNKTAYNTLLQKVLSTSNPVVREKFISLSISNKLPLNENTLLRSFYKNQDDYDYQQEHLPYIEDQEAELIISKLPYLLVYYAKNESKSEQIMKKLSSLFKQHKNISMKDFVNNNFELLFNAEKDKKMQLLEYIMEDLDKEVLTYYKELLRVYKKLPVTQIDNILSTMINSKKEHLLLELIKDKEVEYLGSGSTTKAFKAGDKVIKFSNMKYFIDTEKDLFLLAPTETEVIYDEKNNPDLIIEIQDYLERTYNDEPIAIADIDKFMDELEEQGYVTTDPNCLDYKQNNFGFLKSYKDANSENPEDLPEWFKERPIVMYDIDLIYKKDYPNKKFF